jgi:hypothetical protein
MSEIQEELTEVDKSLKKIQNLSSKLKKHHLHRQNTQKQLKTLNKFISLEEHISRKLSLLSKTQSNIQVLTKLNSHIDDLQTKVDFFELSLDDEYWKRYQDLHSDKYKLQEIEYKKDEESETSPSKISELTTSSSIIMTNNTCKCLIF